MARPSLAPNRRVNGAIDAARVSTAHREDDGRRNIGRAEAALRASLSGLREAVAAGEAWNRDVARLRRKLERAELIIDAQKTVRGARPADRGRVILAVNDLASNVGMEAACRAFAFNPGYVYRDRARRRGVFSRHPITVRPRPPLAFSIERTVCRHGVGPNRE